MSLLNVVIVTAVTIAAVVAIVVVVVLVQESLGGTPIIIKGGSAAEPLTTVKFNEEPGSGPSHPVKGEIQYIQILAPTGNCMVYKFSDWSSVVNLDVTTDPDAYKISADDEIGSGLKHALKTIRPKRTRLSTVTKRVESLNLQSVLDS